MTKVLWTNLIVIRAGSEYFDYRLDPGEEATEIARRTGKVSPICFVTGTELKCLLRGRGEVPF